MIRPKLLKSLSFRLAMGQVGLYVLSASLFSAFIYWAAATFMARQADEIIDTEAWSLAEQYDQRGLGGLMMVIASRLRNDLSRNNIYLLVDRDYRYLAGNMRTFPKDVTPQGYPLWASIKVATSENTAPIEARVLVITLPGRVHLLVGREMSDVSRARGVLAKAMGLGLFGSVLLGVAWGWITSAKLAARLDAVNRASRDIMGGAMQSRIPVTGRGDEFDRLAENLNAMLDRIGELLAAVRQVSDNIAHDLRSPLTRLRSRLELALLEKPDPDVLRQAVEEAIAQAEGIIATFNALLTIAQAESATGRGDFEILDFTALAFSAAELYEPVAEDKSLALTVRLAPGVRVRGNRHLLSQALTNLLDNAVKYTPEGGSVRLGLAETPEGPRLTVADTGPGVPPEERANVLKRFYRLDHSRGASGNGLGLSLVAAVARLHGAALQLEDAGPGLCVRLDFPPAPESSALAAKTEA